MSPGRSRLRPQGARKAIRVAFCVICQVRYLQGEAERLRSKLAAAERSNAAMHAQKVESVLFLLLAGQDHTDSQRN